jgi:hypothetical protein
VDLSCKFCFVATTGDENQVVNCSSIGHVQLDFHHAAIESQAATRSKANLLIVLAG